MHWIIYLHGFNSSPMAYKAQQLQHYCQAKREVRVLVPQLPYCPKECIKTVEASINSGLKNADSVFLVAASLGGYYATYLANKYSLRVALINPLVNVQAVYDQFLGPQENPYTGERAVLTTAWVSQLEQYCPTVLNNPELFFVLLQKGDLVLDYRYAKKRFEKSHLDVQEGGDHQYTGFVSMLPRVMQHLGLENKERRT